MARLGRFERPTLCFGGTRSIQLSYRRAGGTPRFRAHAKLQIVTLQHYSNPHRRLAPERIGKTDDTEQSTALNPWRAS